MFQNAKLKQLLEEKDKKIASQECEINDQATKLSHYRNKQAGLEGFIAEMKNEPNQDTIKTETRQTAWTILANKLF